MLEPNVDQFLERVVFPLIMFSAQEQRQFFEEPDQFIHSLNELNKLVYSARVQAMYLLSGLKDLIGRPACCCVLTFGLFFLRCGEIAQEGSFGKVHADAVQGSEQ